jgi:hypothetical protein
LILDNFRRYFANSSSSFQPFHVERNSGLSISSNLSVANVTYARFAGLLVPENSGRYTFSFLKSQSQCAYVAWVDALILASHAARHGKAAGTVDHLH